jgi:D-xylonolactonase
MPTEDRLGRLYRVDTDGSVTRVASEFNIPNGMGFTPDLDQLYVTDSNAHEIRAYDYDRETGSVSDPEVVVDVSGEAGIPDGMTVDAEGYIWSARWNGGCLVRYAPDGTEVERVDFPARKVSSVAFGDADLTTAYVTTANRDGRETEGDGAGALFALRPEADGREEFVSRVASE